MFRYLLVIMASSAVLATPAIGFGQLTDTQPATAPATEPTTAATTAPADRPLVILCDEALTLTEVARRLQSMPPVPQEQRSAVLNQVVQDWILKQLVLQFVQAHDLQPDPQMLEQQTEQLRQTAQAQNITPQQLMELAGLNEAMLRDFIAFETYKQAQTADEKVQAFIQAHPEYFDGTEVRARHILIGARPFEPTDVQLAAKSQAETLAARIQAGEITFEQAATEASDCPSRSEGGDLGFFPFHRMALPFAQAAFAAKTGELVGPVWSRFGWHLIEVTDRKPGTGEPAAQQVRPDLTLEPAELARYKLTEQIEDDLLRQTHTHCVLALPGTAPAAEAQPQPAPVEPQPAPVEPQPATGSDHKTT